MQMIDPAHPGEIARDNMEAEGWNVTECASKLGVSRITLSRLLNGRAGVSAAMALALERVGWARPNTGCACRAAMIWRGNASGRQRHELSIRLRQAFLLRGLSVGSSLCHVRVQHAAEGLDDRTIRGLLEDQNTALDMVFATIKGERLLSHSVMCEWHALLTRHQDTVTGLTLEGRRVQVEFKEKGVHKTRPNNPRRPDGVVHEYCPPENCRSEMDRLFEPSGLCRHLGSEGCSS